jgi:leishmanolysin-like peptidase
MPQLLLLLLLFIKCTFFVAEGQEHACIHDDIQPESPLMQSAQKYIHNRGNVSTFGVLSDAKPIRITPYLDFLKESSISDANLSFLNASLLPVAYEWLSNVLSVKPVTGNLFLKPTCTSYYGNIDHCASYTDAMCGFRKVPPEHYGTRTLCQPNSKGVVSVKSLFYHSHMNDTPALKVTCNAIQGSVGIPDSDVVVYVYANNSNKCISSPGTLAYASVCQQDQNDRPIAGFINFCPSAINTTTNPMRWSLGVCTCRLCVFLAAFDAKCR